MVLSFDANGSQSVTSSETDLFTAVTSLKTYFCYVSCHNMASGDIFVIRTYVKDENTSTTRVLYKDIITYGLIQNQPIYFVPPVPTNSFKVTIQKLSGTDRTFTWVRGSF